MKTVVKVLLRRGPYLQPTSQVYVAQWMADPPKWHLRKSRARNFRFSPSTAWQQHLCHPRISKLAPQRLVTVHQGRRQVAPVFVGQHKAFSARAEMLPSRAFDSQAELLQETCYYFSSHKHLSSMSCVPHLAA